ncbi:hypothetical protein [Pseudomonas donghuensis]|uniref:hypothetical protein n=1 Tax=Pseudomonas donghuensis TaxID=1163398 RepID=UPI00029A1A0A|nr:hypothetical protein [Pseudomonas donghuensis]
MSDVDFFEFAFSHIALVLASIAAVSFVLYISIRKSVLVGYLDPLHFYWTFTLGTAYGIVVALFLSGYISAYLIFILFSYAFILWFVYSSLHNRLSWFRSAVNVFLVPAGKGRFEFYLVLIVYFALALFLIFKTGLGVSAETNRFEQNRGMGAFVRVADGFRLFLIGYLFLMCVERWREGRRGFATWCLFLLYLFVLVVSSMLNGAKFAVLEAIYASLFALAMLGIRVRLGFIKVALISTVVGFFALFVLAKNLDNSGVDASSGGGYMPEVPMLVERLVLRVLANGDKYYFALPNDVIEELETDGVFIQLLAPLVSVTKMSELVGHPVDNYTIGKQSLLYWYPNYDIAGGPTSHFDLFAYKYFGLIPGFIFSAFIGFLLASVSSLSRFEGGMFYSAIAAALWVRSIPMLLEPAVGLAYMLDIFILFSIIKFFGLALRLASHSGR